MARFDQTIQVLDLSPKVTATDLDIIFSYCGTVDKILLESKEDQSQLAHVTFRQPYALKTALLLNEVVIGGSRVRILPLWNKESALVPYIMGNSTKVEKTEGKGLIPVAHLLVRAISSIGSENLNKAREALDELSVLTQKSKAAAEQRVERVGEVIVNNEHVSAGALWLSSALEKAAKCAAELGGLNKRTDSEGGGQHNKKTDRSLRDLMIN